MDNVIIVQSKKLRRRIEEKLRQSEIEDLIKTADFLDIAVQKKLREWYIEENKISYQKK